MDILYSYFAKSTKLVLKLYSLIIIFFTVGFGFIRSVYGGDLIVSEFFYNQDDVRVEIANIGSSPYSGSINIVGLGPTFSNNISLDTGQTILIGDSFVDVDTSSITKLFSGVGFIVDSSGFSLSLSSNGVESDSIQFDSTTLNHIYLSGMSYQKVLDGSGVWIDGFAIVRQNMTNIDTIANPGSLIQTGEITILNPLADNGLSPGDIQFTEIFPSSGNCMNEFIKIRSNTYYSGLVSFYGLGQSSNIVDYYLNLSPGQELIITDDISGLIPSTNILVGPTITLTNGGEQLKIIVSGVVLDDIVYSDLDGIQSLFHTSNSGDTRLFKTNGSSTPPTKCNQVNFTGGVGLCDIDLSPNYLGTGIYDIDLSILGQYSNICNSGSVWLINGATGSIDVCNTSFQNLLGSNKIEFLQYSGTDLICKDTYMFTSNYDIGYINQYYCPIPIDTGSNNSQSTTINQCTTASSQVMTDCHVKYQGSTVGFFANYEFNTIANIGGTDIQNSTTKYDCYRDMGDGNALTTCNPLGYKYANPGVYTINLTITEKDSSKYCKTSSFVNYPLDVNLGEDYADYLDLQIYITNFCSSYKDLNTSDMNMVRSFCSGFYNSEFLQVDSDEQYHYTGTNYISIYSVLPNPVGSDSLYEEIVLQNLSGNKVGLDGLTLNIGSKIINLSGTIEGSGFKSVIGGLGLVNNGMCIYLKKEKLPLDQFCYESVKEGQTMTRSGQTTTGENNLLSGEDKQLSGSDIDADIDKVGQEIIDLLSLYDVIGVVGDDITIDNQINSLLTSTKLVQDKYIICDTKQGPEYCTNPNYNSSSAKKSKSSSIISKYKIEATIYKNKYYLYKNFNDYLFNQISTWRPFVTEDANILKYYDDLKLLDTKIGSGYIYKSKDNKSYRYLNNFKQIEDDQITKSLLETVYPGLADYIEEIKTYYINKELINDTKTLQ